MVQIRNVPDELHRKFKARAALEGLSLSDYLLRELRRLAELPTIGELRARWVDRETTVLKTPPARLIREDRDRR
jgi:plasmid stability protein